MSNKDRYHEIVEQRKDMIMELKKLEKDEKVKRYLELKKENDELYQEQLSLSIKMKKEDYNDCDHVWITSKIVYGGYIGDRSLYRKGCIKCGLDQSVLDNEKLFLTHSEQVMYDYLTRNVNALNKGITAPIACDLELGQAIYCKIKDVHPDIDDKTLIKYLDIALENIRDDEPNHEREEKRAKRLQLHHSFRNWSDESIVSY